MTIKIITKIVINKEIIEIGTQNKIEMEMLEKIWQAQPLILLVLSERGRDPSNAINAKDGDTLIGFVHPKEI